MHIIDNINNLTLFGGTSAAHQTAVVPLENEKHKAFFYQAPKPLRASIFRRDGIKKNSSFRIWRLVDGVQLIFTRVASISASTELFNSYDTIFWFSLLESVLMISSWHIAPIRVSASESEFTTCESQTTSCEIILTNLLVGAEAKFLAKRDLSTIFG